MAIPLESIITRAAWPASQPFPEFHNACISFDFCQHLEKTQFKRRPLSLKLFCCKTGDFSGLCAPPETEGTLPEKAVSFCLLCSLCWSWPGWLAAAMTFQVKFQGRPLCSAQDLNFKDSCRRNDFSAINPYKL